MTERILLVPLVLISLVMCVAGSRSAEDGPKTELTRLETSLSPKSDLVIEFRNSMSSGPFVEESREIWLADAQDPKQRKLLYTYNRAADVLFSPNEKWLLVDDHIGSNISETYLYRRVSGVEYAKSDVDLHEALWDFFFGQMKRQYDPKEGPLEEDYREMDHNYIYSVRWSKDSDAILFELDGHNSGLPRPWADGWLCVYDLRNKRATLDLNVLNRNAGGLARWTPPSGAEDTSKTKSKVEDAPQNPDPVPTLKLEKDKINQGLFFCHLALEKALKALVCRATRKEPPFIHNLAQLARESGAPIAAEKHLFFTHANKFNLSGRYSLPPHPMLPKPEATEFMQKTQEMVQWLTQL